MSLTTCHDEPAIKHLSGVPGRYYPNNQVGWTLAHDCQCCLQWYFGPQVVGIVTMPRPTCQLERVYHDEFTFLLFVAYSYLISFGILCTLTLWSAKALCQVVNPALVGDGCSLLVLGFWLQWRLAVVSLCCCRYLLFVVAVGCEFLVVGGPLLVVRWWLRS